MKRVFYFILLCFHGICFSQTKGHLDSILSLETKISQRAFLQSILDIAYDKALTNAKKYAQLTQKAENIAIQLGEKKWIAEAYKVQSLAYHFSSKDDVAIDYTLKAAQIFQELNDIESYASSYIDLGWKIKRRDLKKGMFYMLKGIQILEKQLPNSHQLSSGYNNYGVLQQWSNQLDSAYYYHKKSLDVCILKKDSIGIPFAQTHIAEVYIKKKQFDLASQYLNKALLIREKRNDIYGITDSQLYLGDLFYAKKDFKKAIYHFKKGEDLAKKNHYFPLRKYALEYIYKSYDLQSDSKNALRYYKTFNQLKDSILNKDTNSRIAELEIQFQTAEKEKEIAKQKEKILENELTIKTRNLYAILLGAALLILVIISFGVYRRNQYRRKQLVKELELNKALATIRTQNRLQEQRLKISRDLHDNIGSQLTFIISSIDNLKYATKDFNEHFKEKLATISSFTSDTIFQLRDTIWAMNKGEVTYEDFQSRLLSFVEKAKTASETTHFEVEIFADTNITFESIVSVNLFRVVQEALNNAIKHAKATSISIKTTRKEDQFCIQIQDNGIGFTKDNSILGNGIRNMEKRMNEIHGTIVIDSEPNVGTKIVLTLHVKNTSNDV